MAIQPVNLPSSAGIDYSGGDVRHFSLGDAVDVPGLSAPTRALAQRDNLLAEKVNEVVSAVNNREQFVPLPVIRTILPPNETVIVTNYRIPAGFEARVLNAVVNTIPASTNSELDVYYNATTFGGATGSAVITCTPGSEFTGDVSFYPQGEFILALTNTGVVAVEVAASVMLAMRPLGAVGSLLVGNTGETRQVGPPGMTGGVGPIGPPGTSGMGTPGMIWDGPWVNGKPYTPNLVASFTASGTFGSYICRVANTANLGVNDPSVDPVTWNPVAIGSSGSNVTTQFVNVSTSGSIPNYQTGVVYGTLVTGPDWTNLPLNGYYTQTFAANTTYTFISMTETFIQSALPNPGYGSKVGILSAALPVYFTGNGTFTLPKAAYGALLDYSTSQIMALAVVNGTIPYGGTGPVATATVLPTAALDTYVLKNMNSSPLAVTFFFSGAQTG
jgi:hypothetical protein